MNNFVATLNMNNEFYFHQIIVAYKQTFDVNEKDISNYHTNPDEGSWASNEHFLIPTD